MTRRNPTATLVMMGLLCAPLVGCAQPAALVRVTEARQHASELRVQFTKASDATNRAVMADTDEASVTFANEAREARTAMTREGTALRSLLEGLGYAPELDLLSGFDREFAGYTELDDRILALAVENTNLKAQRLAFGAGAEAADAVREAMDHVAAGQPSDWHARALAAQVVAAVRELQALQAPHIADPDEASMQRLEGRMTAASKEARAALVALMPLLTPASHAGGAQAVAALDRVVAINQEIVTLSHRNTNVRSLALVLNDKGKRTVACDTALRQLSDALGQRLSTGTR